LLFLQGDDGDRLCSPLRFYPLVTLVVRQDWRSDRRQLCGSLCRMPRRRIYCPNLGRFDSSQAWSQLIRTLWLYERAGSAPNFWYGEAEMTMSEIRRLSPVVRSSHVQLSIILQETDKGTLQTQIFDQIRSMILNGQLRGGDPLPTRAN
jgi:hypothetical protein